MAEYQLISKYLFRDKAAQDESGVIPTQVLGNLRELGVYVVFKALTSAGVVLVEGSHDDSYQGTWALVATITWAAADRVHYAAITGAHKFLRVRIATAVVGGVADAYVVGN